MPSAVSIPRSPAANANASNAPSAVAFSPRDMSGVGSPKSFSIGSFGNKFYPGCSPGSILETMDFKDMKMSCSIESDGLPRDPVKDEFCRNYTCCGLPLNDLHALVEHFEEAHVRVMPEQDQSALPVFSFNTSTHAEPFDVDDMEMELDSPGSLSPSSTPSSESPPSTPTFGYNPRASLDTSAFDNNSIFLPRRLSSFSTHSASSSRAASPSPRFQPYSRFSQDVQRPQGCLPPALLHSPATTPPASPHVRARTLPVQTSSALASSSSSSSTTTASPREERPPPTNGGGPRTKPFKCPTPNCTKQYKQANGLKYHITHGQCSFLPPDPALEALSDREADERMRPFVCAVPACYPHPTGREKEEMGEGVHVVEGKVEPGVGCGRRYKNMNGLRYHYQHSGAHGAVGLALLQSGAHPIPTTPPHHYRSDRSRERRDQQPPQPQSQHVPPFPHAPLQPSQLHQQA